jgi:hypothetical protein
MSSSLNHYTADVQVTDAVMHNKTPLSTSTFTVVVLAMAARGCRPRSSMGFTPCIGLPLQTSLAPSGLSR